MAKSKEKAAWGTYSKIFWKFYKSNKRTLRKEFPETEDAVKMQRAILNRMNYRHIFDVRVNRRRNVLYLEKTEVGNVRRDNS